MPTRPIVCSLAGSDPSGGAGIQADLKTFAAFGVYGCAVVTALTAQNTTGVSGIHTVPGDVVAQQLTDVLDDVAVDALKIGMLGSADVMTSVAEVLASRRPTHVVLDPVMVATSGSVLMEPDALDALWRLVALADVVTPNLAEAAVLSGLPEATDRPSMLATAHTLRERGARAVLLKGGHLAGDAADLLLDDAGEHWATTSRLDSPHTHGTGCTLSSALAAARCTAPDWRSAVDRAKAYVTRAIAAGADLGIGRGRGPLWHGVEAPAGE